jgi:hypothetical protein
MEEINIIPCESGYRVEIGGVWLGTLIRRVWEPAGQVELDHWRAAPANTEAGSLACQTIRAGLNYLLTTRNA